ncbi:WD40-repeat-containing domain protein [Scenedesmus sp. NREL 46B-D3]|nr:WD40-repeat-containing domain protein [Scenedesmus sp. NREL 46B-D3]
MPPLLLRLLLLLQVWGLREPPVPRLVLPLRANVCSLEYCPSASHLLAVGSAGHQVHLFDLRAPRAPLAVLRGHAKAVSCVRWAGTGGVVSASTDSTLRLWSGTAAAAAGSAGTDVFSGHSNSKHFVGLGTQGPLIACGSETNEVFVYHQGLPRPRMQQGGGATNSGGASGGGGGGKSPFVSAVCWRRDSNVPLAANSRGGVWVLSLVTSGGGPGGSVQ